MTPLLHQAFNWLLTSPRGWSLHVGQTVTTVYLADGRTHQDRNTEDAILGAFEKFHVQPALDDRDRLPDYTHNQD